MTAPDVAVPNGGTAIIRGTVMDISPGCSDVRVQLRFPNGVPAVSEADMSEWMLYVYKQFNRPADAVGVDVVLSVLDSNGAVADTATLATTLLLKVLVNTALKPRSLAPTLTTAHSQ